MIAHVTVGFSAADEAAVLATVPNDGRLTHHWRVIAEGVTDCYVMGDNQAEHSTNVDCPDCLEWCRA